MTTDVKELFKTALALHQKGNYADAEVLYHKILAINPKHDETLHLLGLVRFSEKKYLESIELILQALAIDPKFAVAHFNLGRSYEELLLLDEAEESYRRALKLNPRDHRSHLGLGNILKLKGKYKEALTSFNDALKILPNYAEAHFNKGGMFAKLGRHEDALNSFGKALEARWQFPDVHYLRGVSLKEVSLFDMALKSFDVAVEQDCTQPELHRMRAKVLENMGRHSDALESYEKIAELKKGERDDDLTMARSTLCIWDHFEEEVQQVHDILLQPIGGSSSFFPLQAVDSLDIQRELAVRNAEFLPQRAEPFKTLVKWPEGPIRIGYFSPDFHDHPVSQLLAGVLENHDKSKFQLELYSLGASSPSAMQRRIVATASYFQSIKKQSLEEIDEILKDRPIDIAVDLAGYTGNAKSGIFSRRVAPAQINYLGYPGTVGIKNMDYILGDATVIPPGNEYGFTEKIIRMPHSFFPNDRSRDPASRSLTRKDVGLPEDVFVFCALNNVRKFTPPMFDVWMELLHEVPDSVIWLPGGNEVVMENLRKEAKARGIDSERILFANKIARGDYFERFKCADLFLDTFAYNAHTVAADALWGGIPLLTYAGETFASRVAASQLVAIGLPELVTNSFAAYKAKALELARNRPMLDELTNRLRANRDTSPLYDVVAYTRHLEAAYIQIMERVKAGLPPTHITVKAD